MCVTYMSSNGETRKCWKCNEVKPLDQFNRNKSKMHGRSNICRECVSEYNAETRKKLLESMGEDDKRHGTYYGYVLGCRCDRCREANNAYAREYKRKQREYYRKKRENAGQD